MTFCSGEGVFALLPLALAQLPSLLPLLANSPILLYSFKNCHPFSAVLYIGLLFVVEPFSTTCSRPLSTNTARYSFSCAYDRYALYIIFVFVAPPRPSPSMPSFAASSICATISVLLLYFISIICLYFIKKLTGKMVQ